MSVNSKQDRYDLLNSQWNCECGALHSVPTRIVDIAAGALNHITDIMSELGLRGKILLLADKNTFLVAGAKVEGILYDGGLDVRSHVLEGRPVADEASVKDVTSLVDSDDVAIVSCGSGTITDLAKCAALEHDITHIAIATAPSMNGYASGIAAIMQGGLKTTLPVRPPIAVIADPSVLKKAPIEMIRAGIGDLLSKPVCNADWKLASLVKGEHFCSRPYELVKDLESLYMDGAKDLLSRKPETIAALTEALIFSGISMVIAGSSSPASGAEHLISHFIDMRAEADGAGHDLHGVQVGIASVATARLHERMLKRSYANVVPPDVDLLWKRGDEAIERVRKIFGPCSESIVSEYLKKRGSRESFASEVKWIVENIDAIRDGYSKYLTSSATMREALVDVGAKKSFAELGIGGESLRDVLELAFVIRGRYTILDLAFILGELDGWVDEMITSNGEI
jgi:glycerol-1-phosphate dehydrogenase [NAD(P)+]